MYPTCIRHSLCALASLIALGSASAADAPAELQKTPPAGVKANAAPTKAAAAKIDATKAGADARASVKANTTTKAGPTQGIIDATAPPERKPGRQGTQAMNSPGGRPVSPQGTSKSGLQQSGQEGPTGEQGPRQGPRSLAMPNKSGLQSGQAPHSEQPAGQGPNTKNLAMPNKSGLQQSGQEGPAGEQGPRQGPRSLAMPSKSGLQSGQAPHSEQPAGQGPSTKIDLDAVKAARGVK